MIEVNDCTISNDQSERLLSLLLVYIDYVLKLKSDLESYTKSVRVTKIMGKLNNYFWKCFERLNQEMNPRVDFICDEQKKKVAKEPEFAGSALWSM